MENHRTLVIAEQKLEGDGLVAILKGGGWKNLISEPISIQNVAKEFTPDRSDLFIINMSHSDTEFLKHFDLLKRQFTNTKFFIIAVSNNITLISKLLKLGISGYFLRNSSHEKLICALQCVVNNEVFLPDDISRQLLQTFITQNNNDCKDGSCLTKREHDIFKLLINAESSSQIANELFISELTVNTHRKHILKKMGFNNTASLIKYALQNGIV